MTTIKLIENTLNEGDVAYSIPEDDANSLAEAFPDIHPGSAVLGLRYREDMTQAQLAERIGVKRRHISEMENGKRPIGKKMAKRRVRALKSDYRAFL